jgi:hypothetical protein
MGMQLFSTVGGSTIPIEVDASGTGWKQYSIYLSTNGVTPGSIFARLVGSGKGNFANITFSMTPLDNTSTALTTESEKKLYKHSCEHRVVEIKRSFDLWQRRFSSAKVTHVSMTASVYTDNACRESPAPAIFNG